MGMKRVTAPLDERVRDRIVGRDRGECGQVSSGSEHSVADFLFCFDDEDEGVTDEIRDSEIESSPSDADSCDVNVDVELSLITAAVRGPGGLFDKVLVAHVMKALQVFSCGKTSRQILQRNVMAFLRGFGYDVAICKTKWKSSGGLTAGNHDFIDVVRPEDRARYFINLDFAAEFVIARPTESFQRLLQSLPPVYIGRGDELRQILKVMTGAAKRSLKSRGLHLPPWRKYRFMQNKWLGPYRRTTNLFPVTFSPTKLCSDVNCRAVGFDADVSGGVVLLPAAARTR